MQQILALIVVLFLSMGIFLPLGMHQMNLKESIKTKQILNLSSQALASSLEDSPENFAVLSRGYGMDERDVVGIDQGRLLNEFNDVLRKNCNSNEQFTEVRRKINFKSLCYYDRFYIVVPHNRLKAGATAPYSIDDYDVEDIWLPPYFYTIVDDAGRLIYLNTIDNRAYYYSGDTQTPVNLSTVMVDGTAMTAERKNEAIINKVNQVVRQETFKVNDHIVSEDSLVYTNPGMEIKITNPTKVDPDEVKQKVNKPGITEDEISKTVEYQLKNSNFNILEGITFFVVFTDEKELSITDVRHSFKNHQIAGYTYILRQTY